MKLLLFNLLEVVLKLFSIILFFKLLIFPIFLFLCLSKILETSGVLGLTVKFDLFKSYFNSFILIFWVFSLIFLMAISVDFVESLFLLFTKSL